MKRVNDMINYLKSDFIFIFRSREPAVRLLKKFDLTTSDILSGLPLLWWEGSERHIQLPGVEHYSQLKAIPVAVSPGFYSQ